MRILVDADACPVKKQIVELAKYRRLPVIMLIDTSHVINDGYSEVITVDKERDSVDIKLINLLKKDDIVVTQDYGVAAMALGKGAKALNQNGMVYNADNMDRLLFERYLGAKVRRAGGRTATIRKRSPADDESFSAALAQLLDATETGSAQ